VGALDDLDQLAATVAGDLVTLVTVVQDFSQLEGRFGARAGTIVNNHATRLVFQVG
jgi:type IV secretory pathway TraG/TraD family ATPase VirD4